MNHEAVDHEIKHNLHLFHNVVCVCSLPAPGNVATKVSQLGFSNTSTTTLHSPSLHHHHDTITPLPSSLITYLQSTSTVLLSQSQSSRPTIWLPTFLLHQPSPLCHLHSPSSYQPALTPQNLTIWYPLTSHLHHSISTVPPLTNPPSSTMPLPPKQVSIFTILPQFRSSPTSLRPPSISNILPSLFRLLYPSFTTLPLQ